MNRMFDPRSMAAVAAGMSRSRGVKVTCSGTGAYTTCSSRMAANGRYVREISINIPAEVLETKADAPALLRGYLDHEAAHVRWTSWDVLEQGRFQNDEFLKTVLNVVEDVRVEKRMAAAFQGSRENLMRIAELLFGGDGWKEHAQSRQTASLALSWLLYRLRSKAQPLLEPGAKALGALLDVAVPGVRDAMESVLEHTPEPDSTMEAAELAVALRNALMSCNAPTPADQEARQRAKEAAKQAMKDAGMRPNMAGSLANRAERNEDAAYGDAYRFTPGDVPFGAGGMDDAVNRELDMGNAMQRACQAKDLVSTAGAFVPREAAMQGGHPRLRPRSDGERRASASVCAGLGQRLRSLLQTQSSVRRGARLSGTRLDSRSLWRAGASDGRVFAGRAQGRTPDTEVLLLVDVSGSMGVDSGDYGRIRMANAAMSGVLSALEQVRGVYAGAFTFSITRGRLEHVAVKWPREKLSAALLPWARSGGGTNIPASMRTCAGAFTPETPRKIMIVISDGDDGMDDLRDAERELESRGVEVAGVSVSVPCLKDVLRRCEYAAEAEDIPSAVFGAVQSLLLG